jgi:hypothetical protein
MTSKCTSLGNVQTFYVEDLKRFRGSADTAKALAVSDADQYTINSILGFRGDPWLRSFMSFLVQYGDGDEVWIPWSIDLTQSIPFEEFCMRRSDLAHLLWTADAANKWKGAKNKTTLPNRDALPGTSAYVDLRSYGWDWYSTLDIPDCDTLSYCVLCTYGTWHSALAKTILLFYPLFNSTRDVSHTFIIQYGSLPTLPSLAILVDAALLSQYPSLLPRPTAGASTAEFSYLVGKSFYDPDDRQYHTVTRVETNKQRLIVAYTKPVTHDGRPSKEDPRSIHVRDVAALYDATTPR